MNLNHISNLIIGALALVSLGYLGKTLPGKWEIKQREMVAERQREIEDYVEATMRVSSIREEIKGLPPGGTLEHLLLELRDAEAVVKRYESGQLE